MNRLLPTLLSVLMGLVAVACAHSPGSIRTRVHGRALLVHERRGFGLAARNANPVDFVLYSDGHVIFKDPGEGRYVGRFLIGWISEEELVAFLKPLPLESLAGMPSHFDANQGTDFPTDLLIQWWKGTYDRVSGYGVLVFDDEVNPTASESERLGRLDEATHRGFASFVRVLNATRSLRPHDVKLWEPESIRIDLDENDASVSGPTLSWPSEWPKPQLGKPSDCSSAVVPSIPGREIETAVRFLHAMWPRHGGPKRVKVDGCQFTAILWVRLPFQSEWEGKAGEVPAAR